MPALAPLLRFRSLFDDEDAYVAAIDGLIDGLVY
jgi:hypothetical protein